MKLEIIIEANVNQRDKTQMAQELYNAIADVLIDVSTRIQIREVLPVQGIEKSKKPDDR